MFFSLNKKKEIGSCSHWFSSSAVLGPVTLKFLGLSFMAAKMVASVSSIMFTFRVRTKKGERA